MVKRVICGYPLSAPFIAGHYSRSLTQINVHRSDNEAMYTIYNG